MAAEEAAMAMTGAGEIVSGADEAEALEAGEEAGQRADMGLMAVDMAATAAVTMEITVAVDTAQTTAAAEDTAMELVDTGHMEAGATLTIIQAMMELVVTEWVW